MAKNKDYGLQFVNPDLIKVDPPVKEHWQTTKDGGGGATRDDFGGGLDHLKEVKARIAEGYTKDDFHALRQSDDPREKAIGNSHHIFYGEHPVQVERVGDDLVTNDGRHRVDLAQQSGLKEIPARVQAPPDDPEFAGKPYDAAHHPSDGESATTNQDSMDGSEVGQMQAASDTVGDDAMDDGDESGRQAESGEDPMGGTEDALRRSENDSRDVLDLESAIG